LGRHVGDIGLRAGFNYIIVSTRSQLRGRDPNRNDNDNNEDTRSNSQTRRRTPSVPAQFRFIPPRYSPRTTSQANEQSETAAAEATEQEPNENLAQMYKDMFNTLTVDQQAALLRGRVHLPPNPSHN
jgi:hypothetical protein